MFIWKETIKMNIERYETMKSEIANVAAMQKKQNSEMEVNGKRIVLPLNGRNIEAILYKGGQEDSPLVFATFGGGFIMGGCALDNEMWSDLSKRLKWNILSIGYRTAPENIFPAACDDAYDAMCYFRLHQKEYGINTEIYYTYGASAGGNLATVTTMRDAKNDKCISKQFLFYPYLDLLTDPQKKGHPDDELYSYYLFQKSYVPNSIIRNNPYASPIEADRETLALMPETIIVTAENDTLRHEDEIYRDKLTQAGINVHYLMCEKVEHGFIEQNYSLPTLPKEIRDNLPGHASELFEAGIIQSAAKKTLEFIALYR